MSRGCTTGIGFPNMKAEVPQNEIARVQMQADIAYRAGRLSEAERLYGNELKLLEGQTEAYHAETATCLQRLGDMYQYSGRYVEADLAYRRLLILGEKTLGSDHTDLAEIRATLAQIKAKISDPEIKKSIQGASGEAGSPAVESDVRIDKAILHSHQKPQQKNYSRPVPNVPLENTNLRDGRQECPDLFGLANEERRRAKRPLFNKLRGAERESPPGNVRTGSSPVPGLVVVGSALAAALCLCIPSNAAGCLALAGDVLRSGKSLLSADYFYDLAARLNPRSADIAYKQASVKCDLQQFEQAIADFGKAIAINPNASQPYFERGMTRYKVHDYQNAVADFDRFIVLQPKNATVYVRRGIAYARLGQYDNAVKDYNEATNLDPTNAEAMYNRSWALDLQYDEAMEHEGTQISAQPGEARGPRQSIVAVKVEAKNAQPQPQQNPGETKIAQLTEKIRSSPRDARLYCERAWLLLNLGKLKAATADYDAAITLNAGFPDAYVNRGLTYFKLNQYDKAIKDYSQTIALDGQNASAYYRRAVAFDRLGKYALAASDYQKASRLNPHRAKTYLAMANTDLSRLHTTQTRSLTNVGTVTASAPGATDAGTVHALDSAQTPPSSRDKLATLLPPEDSQYRAHAARALQYLHRKDSKSAIREFNEAASHGTPHKELFVARGLAYKNLGELDKALDSINRAIELAPQDKHLYEIKDILHKEMVRQHSAQPPEERNAQQLEGSTNSTARDYKTHYDQAKNFLKQGEPAEALREYDAALNCAPPARARVRIYGELGTLYLYRKDSDHALTCFNRSISFSAGKPGGAPAYAGRGRVYCQLLHDNDRALADFNECIRLQPGSAGAYSMRAKIYRAMGRQDLAAADEQQASDLRGGQASQF